jgi:hypothetical protein
LFGKTIDLDPGPGLRRVQAHGTALDGFVAEYKAATGALVWAGTIGGPGEDLINDVLVLPDGSITIGGKLSQTADVDPTPATHSLTSLGIGDGFVTHLRPNRTFAWTRRFGGGLADEVDQLGGLPSGQIAAAGTFSSTVDFLPGPGTRNRTSHGATDVFAVTLTEGGAFVRVATVGGTGGDYLDALEAASTGALYLVGSFVGTVDFDPGAAVHSRTSHGSFDGFALKLTPSGAFSWVAAVGGTTQDQFNGAALDAAGNLYVSGFFQLQADFDPGPDVFFMTAVGGIDVFNLELSGAGGFVDAWQMGGSATDIGVAIAALGHSVYATGGMLGSGDYDPGPGTLTLTHLGGTLDDNGFVVRITH